LDACQPSRNFARDKSFPAPLGFVIEQNTVRDEQPVGLAVIDGVPMRGHFADCIRTARIERSSFVLRWFGSPEHFRRTRLVETYRLAGVLDVVAHRIQQ